jgi:predicted Zn-dependent peptidase
MMNNLQKIQPPVFPVERVVIPEVKSFNLNNGVPVYLIDAGTEDIMRLEIVFRAGQVNERIPLLSSTANMMLSEGSLNYSSEELNRLLDYYGAFLNLSPEKDLAGVVLFFLNKHIDKVLELTRELLFRPLFPEAELNALMKKRLRWFMVNREKVSNQAIDQFFESIFGKSHPYGRQLKEQDFEMMNPAIIKEFHSAYYTSDNMTIILSGKIHPKTSELLNKYFGEINSSKKQGDDTEITMRSEELKLVHIEKHEAVQTAIRIGSPTINKRNTDYPGLKILNTILGGYFGSRLMKNIREEKGFTYGISSTVSSLNLSGYKVISTEVSPKNSRQTIDEILSEIKVLQNKPLTGEEMAVVRNYISGEMVRMFDGPFAIAESFRSAWEFGLDINYFHNLSEKILKIKPDEIIELARTYYNIDELFQVTVGPK